MKAAEQYLPLMLWFLLACVGGAKIGELREKGEREAPKQRVLLARQKSLYTLPVIKPATQVGFLISSTPIQMAEGGDNLV